MSTPLIFKALMILALGLRLLKFGSKSQSIQKPLFFSTLPDPIGISSVNTIDLKNKFKTVFRSHISNEIYKSKLHFLIYLGYLLDKNQQKNAGIFRFMWHNSSQVLNLYMVLHFLKLNQPLQVFEKILAQISAENHVYLIQEQYHLIPHDAFLPQGDFISDHIQEFDKIFSLDLYWQKVEEYNSNY